MDSNGFLKDSFQILARDQDPDEFLQGSFQIIQNNGNVKKMAAFMQYWQVHHPQQPGVPTPKIQFFESKN